MLTHLSSRHEFGQVSQDELSRDIEFYNEAAFPSLFTYILGFSYANGNFEFNDLQFDNAYVTANTTFPSDYRIQVLSSDNNVLYDANMPLPSSLIFEPNGEIFDANGNQTSPPHGDSTVTDGNTSSFVPVPYFANAASIRIIDQNGTIKLSSSTYILNSIQGYGGGILSSANYNGHYTITSQPTGILTSTNYSVQLGWRP